MSKYQEIHFTDQLLADGSVHRRFADRREEWRWRGPGAHVQWRDNAGMSGVDEPLGRRIIKRTYADGRVMYGRDQGYGRTAWSNGTLTVNRTTFGGRTGAILAAVGGTALLGAVVAPPLMMSAMEEEQLRQQAQQQAASSGTSGGTTDSTSSGGGDWDDDDGGSDDDFG